MYNIVYADCDKRTYRWLSSYTHKRHAWEMLESIAKRYGAVGAMYPINYWRKKEYQDNYFWTRKRGIYQIYFVINGSKEGPDDVLRRIDPKLYENEKGEWLSDFLGKWDEDIKDIVWPKYIDVASMEHYFPEKYEDLKYEKLSAYLKKKGL